MGVIGKQFGAPSGALGRVAARFMALTSGGRVALGYQLEQHMPPPAQRDFPREGHVLYESDDDVEGVLAEAGIRPEKVVVVGPDSNPRGRIMLGRRVEAS